MAALERLEESNQDENAYVYDAPSKEELEAQSLASMDGDILFSILVPVYKTPEKYFREMIESVQKQSYPKWELLLGDASPDNALEAIVNDYEDSRIKYVKIPENKGISDNTNYVLERAIGDYIGLLDHDDMLTPDALFLAYQAIETSKNDGKVAKTIYSDEDKGDGEMTYFYDANTKPAFDQDYLWSNNYICHFTLMEANLMKSLGFRRDYDGAQDYDIILRAAREISLENKYNNSNINSQVVNISKVLYHWRCHMDSTAVNPQSKLYAYDAGKRAMEDDLNARGIKATVSHSKHLGFYDVTYEDIFRDRPEVAMVAGPVFRKGKLIKGARTENGEVLYQGLPKGFSGGHLHRASVWQTVYAANFENAIFHPTVFSQFLQDMGMDAALKISNLSEQELDRLEMAWANYVHERDMIILYNPKMEQWDMVTIVIPNYNGYTFLEDCLNALKPELNDQVKVLVVDNGSTDESVAFLKQRDDVETIYLTENTGFCGAVNVGIKASDTKYVILLNNDTKVLPGYVQALIDAMEQDETCFSASAKMLQMHAPELIDDSGDDYCVLGWAFTRGKGKEHTRYNQKREVFAACGGASIYRRDVLDEIGLFDERHFAYLEDIDIGYRARLFGYHNIYVPEAKVLHFGSGFSGSKHNDFKVRLSSRNSVYLAWKNMPTLQLIVNAPFLAVGFLTKYLYFVRKGLGASYKKGFLEGMKLIKEPEVKVQKAHMLQHCRKGFMRIEMLLLKNLRGLYD